MTISSSLNAGVAGLNANATRLATISDNISNSSTYGYKRADAEFHSLVINGSAGYAAGGVRTTTTRYIDERGPLVTTGNSTDIAVTGRGMVPVTEAVALDNGADLPMFLMTTGSFRPDENGVLTTETGMVLMGWPANPDGTIPPYPRDTVAGLQPVQVGINQFEGDPTTRMELGVNLPATETEAGSTGGPLDISVEYFGNLGTSETLTATFTPTVPATGSSNEWTMVLTDSASGGAVVGEYTLTFDDSRANGGTLQAVTTVSGGAYDPATGALSVTTAGGPIDITIGAPGDPGGLTQLSNSFAPTAITKDGSPVGNLVGVEIDSDGFVHAVYDIGFTRTIYQIPLVDVPNPNGLTPLDNQAYQISPDSGSFFLWDAGDGPTGSLLGYAREESATDVAAELTELIQTQRAYSSNAKIIQTVDEMLQETTNIKR
ncbi:flagellar hook protein FlgE [Actibacterium mucosum KCTC 23349]|uniref:Flagellar hook protein FlgE n=1 Tax=Actibacterium mucosum KCTC 23349 TaxID=1454373 RepID=A0A037ZP43_9RHOB|nr:flagellar hook-basal body complex protein [Actibacterium mucosum]KAJ57323.1 flagellar hook protein FlgE [Actibacterium mucosum KCTC 23349]